MYVLLCCIRAHHVNQLRSRGKGWVTEASPYTVFHGARAVFPLDLNYLNIDTNRDGIRNNLIINIFAFI